MNSSERASDHIELPSTPNCPSVHSIYTLSKRGLRKHEQVVNGAVFVITANVPLGRNKCTSS